MSTRMDVLLARLWVTCQRLPDYGGDLWGRGLEVMERKYGTQVRLAKFEPEGFKPESDFASMQMVTITSSDVAEEGQQ